MKKQDEIKKNRLIDCLVVFSALIVLIVIFCLYFYNVFVKFQINYATLFNQNVISKASDFHKDIVKVSNSLFTDTATNKFLHNKNINYDYESSIRIGKIISNSTIGNCINQVFIDIPKNKIIYSSYAKQKFSHSEFEKKFLNYSIILYNSGPTISINHTNSGIIYSYNDYRGHIISSVIDKRIFKEHLTSHVYPILYQTILTDSEHQIIMSDFSGDEEKILSNIKKMEKKDITTHGNYLIVKNSSKMYSCTSIIKISDIVKEAVNTGSFLIVLSILFLVLMLVITYYFYFKKKKLILSHQKLIKNHLDVNVNNIIYKLFNKGIVSNTDEVALSEYFTLKESSYFLPIIVGITNYEKLLQSEGYNEVSVLKYGFENIINEVMAEVADIKTINMGKDLIGILLYSNKDFDFQLIENKVKYFENVIYKNFKINIFTTVGDQLEEIIAVQEQISQIINTQNYKFIKNSNIIFLKETADSRNTKYPVTLQTEIIASINQHDKERIVASLEKFRNYITENNSLNAKELYSKLFLAISEHCESSPDIILKYNTFEILMNCDNISKMTGILSNAIDFINDSNKENEKDFDKKIKKIIETEFSNPNFCTQSLIDKFGVTASYFGKKFKQHFNMPFNRYLLEHRLNYAIKLLNETNYTNAKIAKLCGFNSETYFVTIFRKNIGMTPKEYKNKNRI